MKVRRKLSRTIPQIEADLKVLDKKDKLLQANFEKAIAPAQKEIDTLQKAIDLVRRGTALIYGKRDKESERIHVRRHVLTAEMERASRDHGKWYKWTTQAGTSPQGKSGFKYKLPKNGKPGGWHIHQGTLALCARGFHATQRPSQWVSHRLFEVEVGGRRRYDYAKATFAQLRFIREIKKGTKEYTRLRRT